MAVILGYVLADRQREASLRRAGEQSGPQRDKERSGNNGPREKEKVTLVPDEFSIPVKLASSLILGFCGIPASLQYPLSTGTNLRNFLIFAIKATVTRK